jgi:ParB family transcriptional regulator, chromosome partitioning protein
MTAAKSFKQMIRDGEIKRADAMKVMLSDIHEEPGFNLRREGEDLQESIDALCEFILDGGQLPPLEVRPRAEGGVFLVDGHRRSRALRQAVDMGYPAADEDGNLWVSVVAFTGNDADRVARVITSQEGRKLEPLELADGYKRLASFGWDAERIAKKVGKTRQHVDQMLVLGYRRRAGAPAWRGCRRLPGGRAGEGQGRWQGKGNGRHHEGRHGAPQPAG